MSSLAELLQWNGPLNAAIQRATGLTQEWQLDITLPGERVIRDWRTEEALSRTGRKFSGRNILEMLYIKQLRDRHVSLPIIREALQSLSDEALYENLQNGQSLTLTGERSGDAERAVRVLAYGISKQFDLVNEGKIVGDFRHYPVELRQAQSLLSKMAFLSGEEDRYSSLHLLLEQCTRPIHEWAPKPLREHPEFRNMVLIEAEERVPSDDVALLLEEGGHLEEVTEQYLHRLLTNGLNEVAERHRDRAYTDVRRFIVEHPMVDRSLPKWLRLKSDPRYGAPLAYFLEYAYQPAHPSDGQGGTIAQCRHCQAPLRPDGTCRLPSCRSRYAPSQGGTLRVSEALIARPEILRYWCDPGLEELRLYHALTGIYGEEAVKLYPMQDACDVSIEPHIGIDVKDYRDPVRLARKLNSGLGRLRMYRQMYLAVASRRCRDPHYLQALKAQLTPRLQETLTVLSVDEAIFKLKEVSR